MEFAVPDLIWGKKKIPYTTLTWSGTDTQASREIQFEIPWNPFDKDFPKIGIKKGDVVEVRVKGKAIFIGTITTREKTDQIGTASYTARDFLHHLLQSSGTYMFKNTTPEAIAKKVCGDVAVKTSKLFKTGVSIKKMIFEDQCLYDIIVKAYRKVKGETGKNYLPVMDGTKVSVIEKGGKSGVTLTPGVNIMYATYTDTVDNMVDLVKIYNDKHKWVDQVKNEKNLGTYGVYMKAYQKEDGKSAKKEAKSMLVGTTREASVDALGDIRAVSGYSITIKDPATNLEGKFYITSDSHTFENNTHKMSLGLSWKDSMEEGADTYKEEKKEKTETKTTTVTGGGGGGGLTPTYTTATKPLAVDYKKNAIEKANNLTAYYVRGQRIGYSEEEQTSYHSTTDCPFFKSEKRDSNGLVTKTTVKNAKKVILLQGTHLLTCSACWDLGKYGELVKKTHGGK